MESFEYLKLNPNRPIIFLDIDGVLNGGWQHEHLRDIGFSTHAVGMGDYVLSEKLDNLIGISRRLQAQWVLISSWVKSKLPASSRDIVYLKESFGYNNIKGSLITSGGRERGIAVLRCIQTLGLTNYVVVDDSKTQMYPDVIEAIGENIIGPSGRYGLQDEDFAVIYTRLKASEAVSETISDELMDYAT